MKRIQYAFDVTEPRQWAARAGKVSVVPDYVARQLIQDGYAQLHGEDQPEDDGPVAPPTLPVQPPDPPPMTLEEELTRPFVPAPPPVADEPDTDLDPVDEEPSEPA